MCVCQMSQKAFDLLRFVLHCSMAAKDTPKKFYLKSASAEVYSSTCRLCKAVVDRDHSKDLFKPKNRTVLRNAEALYGHTLPQDKSLPHLICRPCERRVDNATKFKNVIAETQKLLQEETRSKRCLDISPSVAQTTSRVRISGSSSGSGRRRSLDFGKPTELQVSI
jgi:hypothetical protein